jgi:ABC-2 type transport system permease protein
LLGINDTLVFLLAGQAAPTALLPGFLRQAAEVLPFRYMLGFPVEVLSGKLDPSEILLGFIYQIVWITAVLLLHNVVWKKGVRHYTAVGG